MLQHWIKKVQASLSTPAPVLDIHDPNAHRSYVYGASGRTYIGNQRLAWEFLRRSQAYRREFFAFLARWQAIHSAGNDHEERHLFESEHLALCERWHLWGHSGPTHPDSAAPPALKDLDVPRCLPPHALHIDGETIDLTHGDYQDYSPTISVRFFLDSTIDEQMATFRRLIIEHRFGAELLEAHGVSLAPTSKKPRRRDSSLPTYLRVLDGELQGLSTEEICGLIHPKKIKKSASRIDKVIARAHELADSAYMDLYRLGPYRADAGI